MRSIPTANILIPITKRWTDYSKKYKFPLETGKTFIWIADGLASEYKAKLLCIVVVDRLTKFANFIPVKSSHSVEDYSRIFIDEIVYLHGISFINNTG